VTYAQAQLACSAAGGGRLPTAGEIYRVRASSNLSPSPAGADSSYLWSSVPSDTPTYQMTIRISDGAPSAVVETTTQPFRCVWPPTPENNIFGNRQCIGPLSELCQPYSRMRWDNFDRPTVPFFTAYSECSQLGGRLPKLEELARMVHAGAQNNTVGYLWSVTPVTVVAGDLRYAVGTFASEGTGWDWTSGPALPENDYNGFRCIWNDEL